MMMMTMTSPLISVLRLCAIPTISMFLGSILVLFYTPGSKLTSAMQHFAAGVVFCAVSVELMPKIQNLSKGHNWVYTAAIAVGFCSGVLLLFVIGRYFDMAEFADDDFDELDAENGHLLANEQSFQYNSINNVMAIAPTTSGNNNGNQKNPPLNRQMQMSTMRRKYSSLYNKKQNRLKILAKRAWKELQDSHFSLPWGMIAAVAVDGSMDGLLIGISFAAGGAAGFIMALALMIEMCFLGISTSTAMTSGNRKTPIFIAVVLCTILPCFILLGGCAGATVMSHLSGPCFVALLAFGVAALLYLVVEELLIACHEDPSADTWFVAIQFFCGFLLVIILEQYSGDED